MLSACTGGDRVVDGSEIVVASTESFTSANSATAYGNTPGNVAVSASTSAGFFTLDSSGALVADESFGRATIVSRDPFEVRYTVNRGITWSDGVPVDSADLLLAWAANFGSFSTPGFVPGDFVDPDTGRFTDDYPDDVVYFDGARESGLQHARTIPVPGADGRSITIRYDGYFADWQHSFEPGLPAHVVASHALGPGTGSSAASDAKAAVVDAITTGDTAALASLSRFWNTGFAFDSLPGDDSLLVASGPYVVSGIEPGESVTLTANPRYSGDRRPSIEKVVIRTIADPIDAVDALADGSVDVITPPATAEVASALATVDGATVDIGNSAIFEHLDLQFADGKTDVFTDALVRRAFLLTVPREKIVADLVAPVDPHAAVRESFVFTPGEAGYDDAVRVNGSAEFDAVDIPGAKALLAQAGSTTPRVCVLFDPTNPRRVAEFAAIRASAAEAGIRVTDCSDPAWEDLLGVAGAYDAALFGWNESTDAVTGAAARLRSGGGAVGNFSHYSNSRVDGLLDRLASSSDADEQSTLVRAIDTALWRDAYGVPLYQHPLITAWSDRVSGIEPLALAPGVLWNVWDWQPAANSPSPAPSR